MKIKKWMAACGLAVFLLVQLAVAGPFEDATAAYNRGDYATALRLMRPLAEQGYANARNNLGAMYENGHGVPEDYSEALKWYRLAADQGHTAAQNQLGLIYAQGNGVPQNLVLAHMWFSLASTASPASNTDAAGNRDYTKRLMTVAQIAEAQRLAKEWLAAHAKP